MPPERYREWAKVRERKREGRNAKTRATNNIIEAPKLDHIVMKDLVCVTINSINKISALVFN